VTGGIAAYKTAELVRCLVKAGAEVHTIMTASAQRFITPLTLQTLTGHPVGTDLFSLESESRIGHIHMARMPQLVVVAPATANIMAKMAAGIADDYLSTTLLATTAPVLVCPAMNVKMWEHPATQRNLKTLRELGYHVLEPDSGQLACNEEGAGRLAELPAIVETCLRILTPPTLRGRRVLLSAGPTWEFLDPVRFISNPSSGKMGYALAAVAARRGAEVHLVSGPSSLCPPRGVNFYKTTTAVQMKDAVSRLAGEMDAIIMAAAVSDYRPLDAARQKVKKIAEESHVTLARNPDILAALGKVRKEGQVLVGFAAETENLVENATEKLLKKNLDLIVANDLTERGSGFGGDTNHVKIVDRRGNVTDIPLLTKEAVAGRIWDRVERLFEERASEEK
jgi:phosphopantothenoylcysteine decarboxylase/phosphopantothenate--cysteine ligase